MLVFCAKWVNQQVREHNTKAIFLTGGKRANLYDDWLDLNAGDETRDEPNTLALRQLLVDIDPEGWPSYQAYPPHPLESFFDSLQYCKKDKRKEMWMAWAAPSNLLYPRSPRHRFASPTPLFWR